MSQPLDPQDDAVASDESVSSGEGKTGEGKTGGRRIAPREARQLAARKRRSTKADARVEAANARAERLEVEAQQKRDEAAATLAQAQREADERVREAAAQAREIAVSAAKEAENRLAAAQAEAQRLVDDADKQAMGRRDDAADAKHEAVAPSEQPIESAARRQSSTSSVQTAGELAAEADHRDRLRKEQARAEKEKSDAAAAAAENESKTQGSGQVKPVKPDKPAKVPKPQRQRGANNNRGWQIAAAVVGVVGLLCSVILAGGALLIALGADQNSGIAGVVADICDLLVGPLKGLFTFSGTNADLKAALVTWGLGSMIYLLVSRLLQSLLLRQVRDH